MSFIAYFLRPISSVSVVDLPDCWRDEDIFIMHKSVEKYTELSSASVMVAALSLLTDPELSLFVTACQV